MISSKQKRNPDQIITDVISIFYSIIDVKGVRFLGDHLITCNWLSKKL